MVNTTPDGTSGSAGPGSGAAAPTAATAQMLELAEKKAEQAEADLQEKRQPYEADPLFMYLWRAKFGTPEYRAIPIVKYFDRKVAKLIGFEGARRNYAVLLQLPLRLREHADRLRAELSGARPP